MNCPLRIINNKVVGVIGPDTTFEEVEQTKCIEDGCAWWIEYTKYGGPKIEQQARGCAMKIIAECIKEI